MCLIAPILHKRGIYAYIWWCVGGTSNSVQVFSFAGLVPRVHQSANTRWEGHITKEGNALRNKENNWKDRVESPKIGESIFYFFEHLDWRDEGEGKWTNNLQIWIQIWIWYLHATANYRSLLKQYEITPHIRVHPFQNAGVSRTKTVNNSSRPAHMQKDKMSFPRIGTDA